MNRFYTSIDESKHLLEFGLKPETADMDHYEKSDGWVTLPKGQISYGGFQIIPCWSVGALLGLLPNNDDFTCFVRTHDFDATNNSVMKYSLSIEYYPNEKDYDNVDFLDNDVVSVLYKGIVWLLQNNYIKTE